MINIIQSTNTTRLVFTSGTSNKEYNVCQMIEVGNLSTLSSAYVTASITAYFGKIGTSFRSMNTNLMVHKSFLLRDYTLPEICDEIEKEFVKMSSTFSSQVSKKTKKGYVLGPLSSAPELQPKSILDVLSEKPVLSNLKSSKAKVLFSNPFELSPSESISKDFKLTLPRFLKLQPEMAYTLTGPEAVDVLMVQFQNGKSIETQYFEQGDNSKVLSTDDLVNKLKISPTRKATVDALKAAFDGLFLEACERLLGFPVASKHTMVWLRICPSTGVHVVSVLSCDFHALKPGQNVKGFELAKDLAVLIVDDMKAAGYEQYSGFFNPVKLFKPENPADLQEVIASFKEINPDMRFEVFSQTKETYLAAA